MNKDLRRFLLIFSFFISYQFGFGQCEGITDCNDGPAIESSLCGTPLNADNCADAPNPSICELDGFSACTACYGTGPADAFLIDFCGNLTITSNSMWIGFTAATTNVNIFFDVGECFNNRGIQAAIIETDCSSFANSLGCVGGNNLTGIGATQPFNLTAANLTVGDPYYIMIDGYAADFCAFTLQVLEGLPDPSFDASITVDRPICGEGDMATLNASPLGSYIYEWTGPNGIITDETGPFLETDVEGEYSVIVRELSECCQAEGVGSVEVVLGFEPLVVNATDDLIISCDNPEVTLMGDFSPREPSHDYETNWLAENGSNLCPSGCENITVSSPETYTFFVQDLTTGCNDFIEVEVTGNTELPTVVVPLMGSLDCGATFAIDGGTGSMISSSSAPIYEWTVEQPDGSQAPVTDMNGIESILEVEVAGIYTLTITDPENGCTASGSTNVTSNAAPPMFTIEFTDDIDTVDCNNESVQVNIVFENAPPANAAFNWENELGIQVASTQSFTTMTAGIFAVTVTDEDNNCSFIVENIEVFEIVEAPIANAGDDAPIQCVGGSSDPNVANGPSTVTLMGMGEAPSGDNVSVAWLNASGTELATTNSVSVTTPGIYTFQVTNDVTGCSSSDDVEVTNNANVPMAMAGDDATLTCNTTSVDLMGTASGGINYTYEWFNSAGESQGTGANFTAMAADTYTLNVINADNNCLATDQVVVDLDNTGPSLAVNGNQPITCTQTEITLTANSSTATMPTFAWSTTENSASIMVGAGTYTVTVTDGVSGCTNDEIVEVVSNLTAPIANAGADMVLNCINEGLVVLEGSDDAGLPNVTYQWVNTMGDNMSMNPNQAATVAGTYTLIVTNEDTGCSNEATVQVTGNSDEPQNVTAEDGVITCLTGEYTLMGSPLAADETASWEGPGGYTSNEASPTITSPGTYTYIVTNSINGCSATAEAIVTPDDSVPAAPNFMSNVAFNILNCGQTTFELTGVNNDPDPNVVLSWTLPDGTVVNDDVVTVDQVGQYFVTATAPNGCNISSDVTVVEDTIAPVIMDIIADTINCNNPTINLEVSTMNSVDYEWSGPFMSPPGNTSAPQVSIGGAYSVTITDSANGCTAESSVMVIEDSTEPMATLTPATTTTISCTNPILTLNGGSPAMSATYEWSTTETTASIDVDSDGIYSLTVTGSNGCTSTATITIDDITSEPTASTTGDVLNCINGGTAQLGAMTDAANPMFEWSLASGTFTSSEQNPTTTEAGVYTVTITDMDNGCQNTAEYEVIDEQGDPDLTDVTGGQINCNNTEVTLGAASMTSGVTYTWSGPGITMMNANEQNPTVSDTGTYTLVVENPNNGCTSTLSAIVDIDADIPVATTMGGVIDCNNMMTGVQLTGSSSVDAVEYSWAGPNGFTSIEQNPIVTEVGSYTLTLFDPSNGCSVNSTTDVTDNTLAPEGVTATGGTLPCSETSITLMGTSTTDDVTYLWSGGSIDPTNENEQNPIVTMSGTYTLTVTSNTNGCETTTTATVTPDADAPNATASTVGLAVLNCDNATMGVQLDGSSTTDNVTIEWLHPDGMTVITEAMPFVTDTGIYTLIVTSLDNGCVNNMGTATVFGDFDEPQVSIAIPDTLTCTETTVTIMGSSDDGGAFMWMGPGIVAGQNDMFSSPMVDVAGIYDAIITGGNGCTATASVEVLADGDIPDAIVVSELDSLTCTITSVNLDGTGSSTDMNGNITYTWEDNTGMVVGTDLVTPVSDAGVYTLFVTDNSNGCINQTDMVVNINDTAPTAEAGDSQTYTCSTTSLMIDGGGSIGQGSLSYEWVGINMEQTAEIFGAGTYELIVTDAANGCTAADEVIIVPDENAPTASATSSNVLTCENLVSTLDGSTSNSVSGADLTYEWTLNGMAVGNTETIEVSEPGNYILIVTDQSNGCTDSTIDFNLGQNITPPAISIATPDTLDCSDQSTNLDATESPTGNYEYLWTTTDGSIIQGETGLEPLVDDAGTYTLMITDNDNGCTSTDFIVVQEDVNIPSINIDPANVFTCSEDEVSLNSTVSPASSDYNYSWSGPSINSDASNANINITEAGTYELLVTNAITGCTETESIDVPPNTAEIADADLLVTPESCVGDENGLIAIENVIGGSAPYIYSLDGGFLGQDPVFSSLSPGTYALSIQDVDGCDYETTVTIGVGNDVTIDLGPDITLELGDSLTLNPQVSNIIDTITWSGAALEGNTPTFTPTNTLTYTATVIDTFGCIDTDEITIFVERNRDIFIPTAFSPNNDDGNNDVFTIYGGNSVANIKTLKVYDRWGGMIFSANDFLPETMGWDGRHNNREMRPAVFVYYAEIEFKDGLTEIFKGDVILMR